MPKQRRIRIRGYEKGSRPRNYQRWLERNGGEDFIVPTEEWDGAQSWSLKLMSPIQDDWYEALEVLHLKLRGRQRQIVDLLFEHKTSQSEIARILGMDQRNVAACLKVIAKKLLIISCRSGVK